MGFESGQVRRGCSSPNPTDQQFGPPSLLFNWNMETFPWGWCVSLGLGADHSPPSNAEVKNEWIYTSSSPVWVLGVYNGSFTVYLQYAARSYIPHPEFSHVGLLRSSYKTSCNLFILFKGCLGRIHENGHLSSSDYSCYDLQKKLLSNKIRRTEHFVTCAWFLQVQDTGNENLFLWLLRLYGPVGSSVEL